MRRIITLFLANAVLSLHYFLLAYALSPYLAQLGLSDVQNGLVFSAAAVLMIVGFIAAPAVLTRISVRRAVSILAIADLLALLALIAGAGPIVAVALIALQSATVPLISYGLDLFLENATTDAGQTGHIRGVYLTAANIVLVASPIIVGIILDATNNYTLLFSVSAVIVAFFIFLLGTLKRFIVDEKISYAASFTSVFNCLARDREMRSVLISNLILQSFYAWVGIYIPLYLHTVLGVSWEALGPLFALMLLPYLIIELPMGFIEDKVKGTRFIMVSGFIIMALSLAAFSFVSAASNLAFVITTLVLTRIGAALVEITAETSFFRDVSGSDIESVAFFRLTRPLGLLIGPMIGSLFLLLVPLQSLFIPLGILCLFGIPFALRIKDAATPVSTRICSVR